jgi:exopolyphosphatase/guanosine-5'-triphosphate,3'-diphosphate pyrophosphatase
VPTSTNQTTGARKITGLRSWMLQVLHECEHVSSGLAADPVHDLRVALRRCRSLADGLLALDPDPDWKSMKKAGRQLFQRLGALRDVQVMMQWVEKLRPQWEQGIASPGPSPPSPGASQAAVPPENLFDAAAEPFLEILHAREKEERAEAQSALQAFDRKQWRQWAKTLPARAARLRPGHALFTHLALERWTEARELHTRALRNRSQVSFHALRIGIKRFRYIVENFLPAEHKCWKDGLKEIQDLLGEVHDLDVLWSTAVSCQIFADENSRKTWRGIIVSQRKQRIDAYRAKMVGPDSLWQTWRAGMPRGQQVEALATRRMKLWAARLDPDFPHSERVTRLALQIYDGLIAQGWNPAVDAASARSSLTAAALLHDIGRCKGDKSHHKTSFDLIRAHGSPLGWKPEVTNRAAIVARFHRGALPIRRHKSLHDLAPNERKATLQLAGILRLANALDAAHDGLVRRIHMEKDRIGRTANEPLIISAEGYSPLGKAGLIVAAERHLLETVLHRAVIIQGMSDVGARTRDPRGSAPTRPR